jgi:hypothetical protein
MNADYSKIAGEVIKILKENFCDEHGTLIQPKKGHYRNFTPKNSTPIFNDLGDYLPFFAELGEDEFCDKQIQATKKHLSKKHLLQPQQKFFGLGFITPYEHSDLILGLVDDYKIRRTQSSLDLAEKITKSLLKRFRLGKASFYFPSLCFALPLADSNDGMFIELLVELYKITKDEFYLKQAKDLTKNLQSFPSYKKHYLLTSLHTRFRWLFPKSIRTRCREIRLMKNNSNTLFGLLELYKVKQNSTRQDPVEQEFAKRLKKQIRRSIRAIKENFQTESGCLYRSKKLNPDLSINHKKPGPVDLTQNFPILDFTCDAYQLWNEKSLLKFAQEIGDCWIGKQSFKTGLLPELPNSKSTHEAKNSYFDSETDMLIAFRKLAKLSGEKKYANAADKIMEGILTWHRSPEGYYLKVDITNGQATDKHFKTKFISLFLKALILYKKIADDPEAKIYQDSALFDLLKDR